MARLTLTMTLISTLAVAGLTVPADAAASVTFNNARVLTIKGTGGDEVIEIVTIYGESSVSVEVDGVLVTDETYDDVEAIKIDTGAGNDRVIADIDIDGAFIAKLGAGDDYLSLGRPPASSGYGSASLTVDTGNGDDRLRFHRSVVNGKSNIIGRHGDLHVRISDSGWWGDTTISKTGSGNYDFDGYDSLFTDKLTMRLANGDDKIVIGRSNQIEGPVFIDSRGGSDEFDIEGTDFRSNLSLVAGSGDDTVRVEQADIDRRFTYNGGSGADRFHLSRSEIGDRATINGGGQNDSFSIFGTVFQKAVTFNGGSGQDSIGGEANIYNSTARVVGIEIQ